LSEPMGIQVHPTGFPSTSPAYNPNPNPNPTQRNTTQHKSKKAFFHPSHTPRFRTPSFHQLITKLPPYLHNKHPLTIHPSDQLRRQTLDQTHPSPYPFIFSRLLFIYRRALLSPWYPAPFLNFRSLPSRIENPESGIPGAKEGEEDDVREVSWMDGVWCI
jgi:hypothetical protein